MATVSLLDTARNNQKRQIAASVGTFKLTNSDGTAVSGNEYQVAIIPANTLLTSLNLLIEESFGAGTADIGLDGDNKYKDNLSLSTSAGTVTASTAVGTYSADSRIVTVVPSTISAATRGSLRVIAQYVEIDTKTGSYTK